MSRFQGPPVRRYALLAHLNNLVVKKKAQVTKQTGCVLSWSLWISAGFHSLVCVKSSVSHNMRALCVCRPVTPWYSCRKVAWMHLGNLSPLFFHSWIWMKSTCVSNLFADLHEAHERTAGLQGREAVVAKSSKALCVKTRRGFVLCAES